jgi:hypothetical protein
MSLVNLKRPLSFTSAYLKYVDNQKQYEKEILKDSTSIKFTNNWKDLEDKRGEIKTKYEEG